MSVDIFEFDLKISPNPMENLLLETVFLSDMDIQKTFDNFLNIQKSLIVEEEI